jgi:hypothetical protein
VATHYVSRLILNVIKKAKQVKEFNIDGNVSGIQTELALVGAFWFAKLVHRNV